MLHVAIFLSIKYKNFSYPTSKNGEIGRFNGKMEKYAARCYLSFYKIYERN